MKIEHNSSNDKVLLSSLSAGEVFEIYNYIWMKITNEGHKENAVRMDDGSFVYLSENFVVTPLPNAKLIIK